MFYNSPEHFLTAQTPAITELVEAAQRAAGGHYAAYSPADLHQTAIQDALSIINTLRNEAMELSGLQDGIRATYERGIDLDDLMRMAALTEQSFIALVDRELHEQPDVAAELKRRIRHFNTRFRSNVTSVKLDITLGRMKRSKSS